MRVYLGIDWSQAQHDACLINHRGAIVGRLTVAHTPDGCAQLDALRAKVEVDAEACWVRLETAHTALIDWPELTTIPRCLRFHPMPCATRERYRQTSAYTDQAWLQP